MDHHSLSEFNQLVQEVLSKNLDPTYWIVAEIAELRTNPKGHCYIELVEKEDEQIKAKMRATIWSYTYRNLSSWFEGITGQSLKSGMKILFNGELQFHEVFGMSINIKDIDANFTLGERSKNKREVIDRLMEDGIFEMNKELNLPLVPQNIAVISSSTAAGLEDFQNQLNNNENKFAFNVELFQSSMQGEQAEESIIQSLERIYQQEENFDLVVIIRGGGASVDLDCFDAYELNSHIAQFPIPIISGIGHTRDETITDMVSHTALKTPTAVAEFVIRGMQVFDDKLTEISEQLLAAMDSKISEEKESLQRSLMTIYRNYQHQISKHHGDLGNYQQQIISQSKNYLQQEKRLLMEKKEGLKQLTSNIYKLNEQKLSGFQNLFEAIDPKNVMKLGFTITMVNGKPLKNINEVKEGDEVHTIGQNIEIKSTV